MAFKMKGSPMQRNYGIGTPTKKTGDPEKDAAIANAMPAAEVPSRNQSDLDTDKAEMEASKRRLEEAKTAAITGGADAKQAYDKAKRREAKIQSQLNVAPLTNKKA